MYFALFPCVIWDGVPACSQPHPLFAPLQTILASEKLPQVYEQSSWGAEELGPFLRLCLMDQNFPAFVEEVEKELRKITQSWESKALHIYAIKGLKIFEE